MTIRTPFLVNQALGLESEHNLMPHFSFDVSHRYYRCTLKNKITGVVAHTGTSPVSEEAAFRDAINTIDIKALTAKPQELSAENKDLHARIRDLESQLENESSNSDAKPASDASADSEGSDAPVKKKKVGRKKASKKASLDLPDDPSSGVGLTQF